MGGGGKESSPAEMTNSCSSEYQRPCTSASGAARITTEFGKALKSPDVLARLNELNAEPVMSSQAEFAAHLQREYNTLGKLIKVRGIKAE